MSKKVYKYELPGIINDIDLPKGANVLACRQQGSSQICLWAEVDTNKDAETRTFVIVPTGGGVPNSRKYIDTIFVDDTDADGNVWKSKFVFHVYEDFDTE